MALQPLTSEEIADNTDQYIEQIMSVWADLLVELEIKHARYDNKMIRDYLDRRGLAKMDVRYVFEPGALVLLKGKVPGRRKTRAIGPYFFLKYVGPLGVVAQITSQKGKIMEVSATHLLPVHDSEQQRLMRFDAELDREDAEVVSEDSFSLPASSDDGGPPEGVIV